MVEKIHGVGIVNCIIRDRQWTIDFVFKVCKRSDNKSSLCGCNYSEALINYFMLIFDLKRNIYLHKENWQSL